MKTMATRVRIPFPHFLSTTPHPIASQLTPLPSTGLDFLEKKTGHTLSRDQNEKITDGARGMFEKLTGKDVDSKYSN